MWKLALAVLVVSSVTFAQEPEEADPWTSLAFLTGEWEGTGEGQWGTSTLERSYERVLNASFLMGRNRSVYEPQEKNPDGETHTNWDFFSYDNARETFVLRQFHDEAFVNQFVLDSISPDGNTLVFTSEQIENFIPGWRARETYRRVSPNEFTETFELAGPDQEFKTFVENRFKRKP